MISNLVSLFIASRLEPVPIYHALAIQDGIHLPTSESRTRSRQRQVARVIRPLGEFLPADITIGEAAQLVGLKSFRSWLVLGGTGVLGVVNRESLEKSAAEASDTPLAGLVAGLNFPYVHADQTLEQALERLGENQLKLLPVVNRLGHWPVGAGCLGG
jgi:chloride channel protein, CIC family